LWKIIAMPSGKFLPRQKHEAYIISEEIMNIAIWKSLKSSSKKCEKMNPLSASWLIDQDMIKDMRLTQAK